MRTWLARAWYEVRWWWWFLFTGKWPVELYNAAFHVDAESRRLVIDRAEARHDVTEPQFRGTYPHRKTPVRPFVPGMTLAPGESTDIPFDLAEVLRPQVIQAINDGRSKLEMRQRPVIQNGTHYESQVDVFVDGVLVATMHLGYDGEQK